MKTFTDYINDSLDTPTTKLEFIFCLACMILGCVVVITGFIGMVSGINSGMPDSYIKNMMLGFLGGLLVMILPVIKVFAVALFMMVKDKLKV